MEPPQPELSVVCLCHNQAAFVAKALDSAWQQGHEVSLELLIADDASQDGSPEAIRAWMQGKQGPRFWAFGQHRGNCRAFNTLLRHCRGRYVIDLAADDWFFPGSFRQMVDALDAQAEKCALLYANAELAREDGSPFATHFPTDANGNTRERPPSGNLYARLLKKNFLPVNTLLFWRAPLQAMGGYDESLSFEDYDILLRISRAYPIAYLDRVVGAKRIHRAGHSQAVYRPGPNPHLESVARILEKQRPQLRLAEERRAWCFSARYHYRMSLLSRHKALVERYRALLQAGGCWKGFSALLYGLFRAGFPLRSLYFAYRFLKTTLQP